MDFGAGFSLNAVVTMWLVHLFFGTFVLAHYYHPWVALARRNQRPLFWPHDQMAEPPKWPWPPSHERWPTHPDPMWPPVDPADHELGAPHRPPHRPNEVPRSRFDQSSPDLTPANQVTPESFGFTVPTTNVKPILKASSTPTERQFISSNEGGSSQRPTRAGTLQTASSVSVGESSSTTTEPNTPPPTTQDAVQAKIQISKCINNCVTDISVKSVCGSDNKTYQNRQALDCAQKCGQNIRLDYTGRCIPNPTSG